MIYIAEVGSNWKNLNDCLLSVKKAKESKASVIKFQLFTPYSLFGPQTMADFKYGVNPYLDPEWLPEIKRACLHHGIELMCTGFSPREYEMLNFYVDVHKIASAELTDTSILKTVNSFKKPVYLSTAGSDYDNEVANALSYLSDCSVTLFYCVGDYPARVVDFFHLDKMREHFGNGYQYGYSDHSIDVLNIPRLAVDHGACVIEKHVNLCGVQGTPDAGHSISGEEFALMVDSIEGSLDHDKTKAITNKLMESVWKRRFVATRDINMGDKITVGENIGIYRPMRKSEGAVLTFRPWELPKVAARSIHKGSVITYDMLDESI